MSKLQINETAKVDILLPYWGDFELLKKAVESVLAQTTQEWRLLVVDDCYPTDEAEQYFAKVKDSRIVYHKHKENIGLVKNFNYVLDRSTAKYCVIFGCDDIMLPDYIQTALLKIGDSDYYQPGVNVIDGDDNIYLPNADKLKRFLRPKEEGVYTGEKMVASLCHGNWLYFPSILWKTQTLKRYRFSDIQHNTQDLITEINIIKEGGSMVIDNTVTFYYRRSANSFSSKAKKGTRFSEEKETYSRFAKEFSDMGWMKASRAARWHITSRIHQFLSSLVVFRALVFNVLH